MKKYKYPLFKIDPDKKLVKMFKPSWKLREGDPRKKESWKTRRSAFLFVAVLSLFIWVGYKLAILWHVNFPESFPAEWRWLVGLAGGEMGAVACFLVIFPLINRRKK